MHALFPHFLALNLFLIVFAAFIRPVKSQNNFSDYNHHQSKRPMEESLDSSCDLSTTQSKVHLKTYSSPSTTPPLNFSVSIHNMDESFAGKVNKPTSTKPVKLASSTTVSTLCSMWSDLFALCSTATGIKETKEEGRSDVTIDEWLDFLSSKEEKECFQFHSYTCQTRLHFPRSLFIFPAACQCSRKQPQIERGGK